MRPSEARLTFYPPVPPYSTLDIDDISTTRKLWLTLVGKLFQCIDCIDSTAYLCRMHQWFCGYRWRWRWRHNWRYQVHAYVCLCTQLRCSTASARIFWGITLSDDVMSTLIVVSAHLQFDPHPNRPDWEPSPRHLWTTFRSKCLSSKTGIKLWTKWNEIFYFLLNYSSAKFRIIWLWEIIHTIFLSIAKEIDWSPGYQSFNANCTEIHPNLSVWSLITIILMALKLWRLIRSALIRS